MLEGSIDRLFYDVDIPAMSPLFMLRVNELNNFPDTIRKPDDLMIAEGLDCDSFVICFSFEGKNGKPWSDILMQGKTRAETKIALIGLNPDKLHILVSCDEDIPEGQGDLSIWIPETHKVTKKTD